MKDFPIDAFTTVSLVLVVSFSVVLPLWIAWLNRNRPAGFATFLAAAVAILLPAAFSAVYSKLVVGPIYWRYADVVGIWEPWPAQILSGFPRLAWIPSLLFTTLGFAFMISSRTRSVHRDPS